MANIIIFITEEDIKQTSLIDENVDVSLIRNTIREAQDLHIHEILGTGLYNELKTQIDAGTLTALNTTLLDSYVRWSLLYWSLYEGVDVLTYKFRNKSIMKMSSDNGQPISLDEVKRLMDSFKNKAEWYSERVTRYLCENQSSYPLYINPGTGSDTIHPKRNNYDSGWHLGRDNYNSSYKDRFDNTYDL